MNKQFFIVVFCFLVYLTSSGCAKGTDEISANNAISLAKKVASESKFDISNTDIEVLKVKKGLERGPFRFAMIMRVAPKETWQGLLDKDFWIVFFYPKGQLENADTLGGDFITIIDLHSGKTLAYIPGR